MQNTFCTKQLSEFTFQAIENWQKLGQSNLKVWEKLFQSQIELATALVDVVSLNGEEIAQSKDAAEIASLQAESKGYQAQIQKLGQAGFRKRPVDRLDPRRSRQGIRPAG